MHSAEKRRQGFSKGEREREKDFVHCVRVRTSYVRMLSYTVHKVTWVRYEGVEGRGEGSDTMCTCQERRGGLDRLTISFEPLFFDMRRKWWMGRGGGGKLVLFSRLFFSSASF